MKTKVELGVEFAENGRVFVRFLFAPPDRHPLYAGALQVHMETWLALAEMLFGLQL